MLDQTVHVVREALRNHNGHAQDRTHRDAQHPAREGIGALRAGHDRVDAEDVADAGNRPQVFRIAELGADDQKDRTVFRRKQFLDGRPGAPQTTRQHAAMERKPDQAIDQLVGQDVDRKVIGQGQAWDAGVTVGDEQGDRRKPALEQSQHEFFPFDHELIEATGLIRRLERSIDRDAWVVQVGDRDEGHRNRHLKDRLAIAPRYSNLRPSRVSIARRIDSGTGCGFWA